MTTLETHGIPCLESKRVKGTGRVRSVFLWVELLQNLHRMLWAYSLSYPTAPYGPDLGQKVNDKQTVVKSPKPLYSSLSRAWREIAVRSTSLEGPRNMGLTLICGAS